MNARPYARCFALLCLTVAVASAHARAQVESGVAEAAEEAAAASTDSSAPTIRVYSREILVDVSVTDDKGNFVRGLKRADFSLLENGKLQHIRGFSETDAGASSAHTGSRTLPPHVFTNVGAVPQSGPVHIFFMDVMDSSPDAAVHAKLAAIKYLHNMPAGTTLAIFDMSCNKGLRLLQGFTSDRDAAIAAMESLDPEWIRKPCAMEISYALPRVAAYVAGVKGRKNLLWLVPGMPAMLTRDGGQAYPTAWGPDMSRAHRLMDLYEKLTADDVAVYPIDPTGVHGLGSRQLRAEEVAEGTGAITFYNRNDVDAGIGKAIEHGSSYYTLSYVPPDAKEDSRFHSIKVQLSRAGLHLTYRTGYNAEHIADTPPEGAVQMNQASMGHDVLPSTQVLFDARVEPSKASDADPSNTAAPGRKALPLAGKHSVPYDVLFTLQPQQITFSQSAGQVYTASLEFDLVAYGLDGKVLGVRSQTLKLPMSFNEYEAFEQTPFHFYLPIDLPTGELTVRMGVFDAIAGHAGTLEVPLTVVPVKPPAR